MNQDCVHEGEVLVSTDSPSEDGAADPQHEASEKVDHAGREGEQGSPAGNSLPVGGVHRVGGVVHLERGTH